MTTRFGKSAICGFAAVGKLDAAVHLLPGTKLEFEKDIRYYNRFSLVRFCVSYKIATFRQFSMNDRGTNRDALEFRDGRIVMVTELTPGQTATVVQLPPSAPPASPP